MSFKTKNSSWSWLLLWLNTRSKFNANNFFWDRPRKILFPHRESKSRDLMKEKNKGFAISWAVWELLTFHRFYLTCGKIRDNFMILSYSHRGSEMFSTLSRCFHIYTKPELGRKHVSRATMRKSKNHENFPYLTTC